MLNISETVATVRGSFRKKAFWNNYLIVLLCIICSLLFVRLVTNTFIRENNISFSADPRTSLFTLFWHLSIWVKFLFLLSVLLLFFPYYKPVDKVQVSSELKFFIAICMALVCWSFSLNNYNYYLGDSQFLERMLLLVLGCFFFLNPYSILLFVLYALLLSKRLQVPGILTLTFVDKKIIFDFLTAFLFFLIVRHFIKRLEWKYYYLTVLVILCNWYFVAGLDKLQTGWIAHNSLYTSYSEGRIGGWTGFFLPQATDHIESWLYSFNKPIAIITVIIELFFSVLLFIHLRLNRTIIIFFILTHLMIFLLSGILFWKWIVILALILYLISKPKSNINQLNNWTDYSLYIITLLFFAQPILKVDSLRWTDPGPLMTNYTIKIIDKSGKEFYLNPSYFSPFDVSFSQHRFDFLNKNTSAREIYFNYLNNKKTDSLYALDNSPDPELEGLFKNKKNSRYDSLKTIIFSNFITQFVRNKAVKGNTVYSSLAPPRHIWQNSNQENLIIANAIEVHVLIENYLILPMNKFKYFPGDSLVFRFP